MVQSKKTNIFIWLVFALFVMSIMPGQGTKEITQTQSIGDDVVETLEEVGATILDNVLEWLKDNPMMLLVIVGLIVAFVLL